MSEQTFKAGDKVKFVYDNEERDEFHGTIIGGEAILDANNVLIGFSDSVMVVETDSPVRYVLSVPVSDLIPVDPHADYPNGAAQYVADLATLTEAGALADKATRGEWMFDTGDALDEAGIVAVESGKRGDNCYYDKDTNGDYETVLWYLKPHRTSDADFALILNAARVADALSRWMPYALAKMGDTK